MTTSSYIDLICNWVDSFDINSVPLSLRKQWHFSYERAFLASMEADYENPLDYINESINEDEIEVEPLMQVVRHFVSTYNMNLEQFVIANHNGVESLRVYDVPVFSMNPFGCIAPKAGRYNLDIIDKEMTERGYYRIRTSIKEDNAGLQWYVIGYNPVRQVDIYDAVKYFHWIHFSPCIFRKSILENGLMPSSGNNTFRYLNDRVYFYVYDFRYKLTMQFKKMMHQKSIEVKKQYPEWTGEFDAFEIDKDKLKKKYRLYYDPNVDSCVYVTEKIPSETLQIRKTGLFF